MRGAQNAGKDIRPIGDRNRKWERIVKLGKNCYVLQDGWNYGDTLCRYYGEELNALMVDYAPIVWRKHRDGTETVTIRNGVGPGIHPGRYAFLYRHTPKGIWFNNRNGKHFITVNRSSYHPRLNGTDHYLAKQMKVPAAVCANKTPNRWNQWMQKRERSPALTFKNLGGGNWEYMSGGKEIPKPPRQVIDKTLKSKLKPHIEEFREWAYAMVPMLPMNQVDFVERMRAETLEHIREHYVPNAYGWDIGIVLSKSPKMCRNILKDSKHTMRVHLAHAIFHDWDGDYTHAQGLTFFNRKINKLCNLTKKVKG